MEDRVRGGAKVDTRFRFYENSISSIPSRYSEKRKKFQEMERGELRHLQKSRRQGQGGAGLPMTARVVVVVGAVTVAAATSRPYSRPTSKRMRKSSQKGMTHYNKATSLRL